MQVLRIADRDERGYLSVGLKQLLSVVAREGPNLLWVLQDLHVSGDPGKDWSVQKLEQATRQAPFGLRLTWSELTDFAQKLTQIQEGLVIGVPPASSPPAINKSPADITAYVIFEAVDSSYWEVHSTDVELLKQIRSQFHNVTVVPTTQ